MLEPVLKISKFGFADNIRSGKRRIAGMCKSLKNFAFNLGDALRVRGGYGAYTYTPPANTDILKVARIQNPSQENVHISFAPTGVYMNPFWIGSSKQSTDLKLNPDGTLLVGATFTFAGTRQIKITDTSTVHVAPFGLSSTVNYYKGYMITDGTHFMLCTAWDGVDTFTFNEVVNNTGLNITSPTNFSFYKGFHENQGFSPTYLTDKDTPPFVGTENSIIRLSGGASNGNGYRGIKIIPRLTRTFFPDVATYNYAHDGTYFGERECKAISKANLTSIKMKAGLAAGFTDTAVTTLETGKTYWIGVSPRYDGYQIGKLTKFEDSTGDYDMSNFPIDDWTYNYLKSTTTNNYSSMVVTLEIVLPKLSKFITGFDIWMAQDDGDTRSQGRQTDYFYIDYASIIDSSKYTWTYDITTGKFSTKIQVTGQAWDEKGNTFTVASGYVPDTPDMMYAHSGEEIVGGRHWIYNAYVNSEGAIDKQKLFTNPIGAEEGVNSGLIQPDIFSNEDGIYRLRIEPTAGTKINAVVSLGLADFLVLKDRGVILNRLDFTTDNIPSFTSSILSHVVGASTFNGFTKGDDQWVYFAGYDDIYRYRQYKVDALIEREDGNDWLNTYRSLTKTQRESAVLWYLPQGVVYIDMGIGRQFAFYPNYGWTEVSFNRGASYFKWMSILVDGTVIGTEYNASDAAQGIRQFQSTAGALYFTDNGTAIIPYLDTGNIYFDNKDFLLDRIVVYRTIEDYQGTLEFKIYCEGTLMRTYTQWIDRLGFLPVDDKIALCAMVTDQNKGYFFSLIYNSNATPETLNTGSQYQIDSIEFYGRLRTRGRRASEVAPLPPPFILDETTLDDRSMG